MTDGGATLPNLPAGYMWVPFPFLVTVKDGSAVRAEQIWVP